MNADHELIDTYLDGELTAEEESRLADWLAADPGNMHVFVRETHLHRQLREIMLADSFQAGIEMPVEKTERTARLLPFDLIGRAIGQWFALPAPQMLRRPGLAGAFCLALIIGAGVWLFGPTMGQPMLAEIHGAGFSIERAGQPVPARIGMPLQSGDVLRTPSNVSVVIGFAPEATQITLQSGTELTLTDLSHGKRVFLRFGRLEAFAARQRPFRPMLITTPQAEARVVGTRFKLTAMTNSTRLDVAEGKVKFTRLSDLNAISVTSGHYAVVMADYELAALPFTGNISREWWGNMPTNTFGDLRNNPGFLNHPDGWNIANQLDLQPVKTNHFGMRFCGYLHPPVTGDYEFWVAGATYTELLMSPDDDPDRKVVIAITEPRYSGFSEWAPPVPLVAGRIYYIEAIVLVATGEGSFSVAWKRPDKPREPLTGEFLSPLEPPK
jgi:ferric-dicitrate binding protein FerR (iron transport regulator)